MTAKHGENGVLKSGLKTFTIIESIQQFGHAGVTEIAQDVDLPKSTVHVHLSTLEQTGYVVKENGRYRLGLRFLDHGMRARDNLELVGISAETLRQVAAETGEMVWLVVEEQGRAVYIKKARGERAVQTHPRLGRHLHLHYPAAGKAILSELSDDRVEELIDNYGLPKKSEHTITDKRELFENLQEIRKRGVAFNRGEEIPGVRAVGAPIIHDGTVHGAISIAGPSKRLTDERFTEQFPEIVLGATNEIELKLAYEHNVH